MSSRKREIGQFQVVVALQGQKKVQKKSVMHLQGCCFAYLNVLIFCRSCCCPHSHCLKLPINSNIPQNSQVVSNCKPIAFLPFSLLSSPSLLKLPINSNIPQNSYSEQLGIKQQFSFYRRMAMLVPVSWRLQGTCNSKRIPGLNNVRKRYPLTIKDNLAIPCYPV